MIEEMMEQASGLCTGIKRGEEDEQDCIYFPGTGAQKTGMGKIFMNKARGQQKFMMLHLRG
mgnify:CR=1 FL=1